MILIIFFLWLIFGSLGSVIMTRFADWATKKKLFGFFFWYSECPNCHHRLQAKNLVPVMSYLIQWGKCEYCKKKISRIYPVLELLCAGVFVLTYFVLKDFWTPILIFWLLMNRLLILLFVYDLKEGALHMVARMLLVIVWIFGNIFLPGGNLWYALLSASIFVGVFTCIYFFAKRYAKIRFNQPEWFGEGDIYLAGILWLLLPIFFPLVWITISWWMLVNVLILFILMSSILGLVRAWLQYLLNWQLKMNNWKWNVNHQFSILHSQSKVIPFFPAMIIAFRIIIWKAPYFITLLFW